MKKKNFKKRLLACFLVCVMVAIMAVPVSAASYTKTKSFYVKAGQCYHIMNKNISRNKIRQVQLTVRRSTSDTMYDMSVANEVDGGVSAWMLKDCRSMALDEAMVKPSYMKASASSNKGLLTCIKVTRGKVKVTVKYKAGYKKAAFSVDKQKSSHSTFASVTARKGQKISFTQRGSNVSYIPVGMAAKKGATVRRIYIPDLYDAYVFKANSIAYRVYESGAELTRYRDSGPYIYKVGQKGYMDTYWPRELGSTAKFVVRKGTVSFYYPTDLLKMKVSR